jgi:hypothetical protein
MTDQDDRDSAETAAEEASVDEAVERMQEHDSEREAAHKQGLIEKETRRRGLDDG